MKTFEEWWIETFKALDLGEKIALYNDFARENGYEEIFDFDEDFLICSLKANRMKLHELGTLEAAITTGVLTI